MQWKQKTPKIPYDDWDDIITKLAKINGVEDIDEFLNPSESSLHSPYLLDNIEKVRDKIIEAIDVGRKISIFVDVDGDGISSTAVMYNYLRNFTDNVVYFHAQRSAGHGIITGIDMVPKGTELLIIVDSSTSSDEECKLLNDLGVDVIIIDHHPPEQPNKHALIVNPTLDNYPNKSLSGSAVCWKVCFVLDDYFNTNYADDLVDLAGIGLISDMMNMRELENRYIVHKALNNIQNKGIMSLLDLKKRDISSLSSTDIGFNITPLLNAAARLDKIQIILELLVCQDDKHCKKLAKEINELNEERKVTQAEYVQKLLPLIDESKNIIVLVDDEISKGFNGLVANDISKKFKRPTLLLNPVEDDRLQGSFRSVDGFALKDFLSNCPQIDFTAGHSGAGGVGLLASDRDAFIAYANQQLSDVDFSNDLLYDLELDTAEIDEYFIDQVEKFNRITGERIQPARFLIKGLFVESYKVLGNKGNHVKIHTDDGLDLLKFYVDDEYIQSIPTLYNIDVVGQLNLNNWTYYDRNKRGYVTNITKQVMLDEYQMS